MNKRYYLHLKNKYPGGQVMIKEDSIDVYDEGVHVLAMRQNGAGQLLDVSEELGLRDKFDLAPIPKDARLYKEVDGKICKDDLFEERSKKVESFVNDEGKVLSCDQLKKAGLYEFDEKQRVVLDKRAK